MPRVKTWTDQELKNAVRRSRSMRECAGRLGLAKAGGTYRTLKPHIKRLNIDTSHWLGQGWRKGSVVAVSKPIPLSEILVKNSTYTNIARLKIRILKKKLLPYVCAVCGNKGKWCGKPLVLRLDHINGIYNDHRLRNLRFLCPNCDSQTDTYCGKNIK